jgi:hypothetical protein
MFAGYSAYASRWTRTPELALNAAGEWASRQIPNSAAKADRLITARPVAQAADVAMAAAPTRLALASAQQGDDLDRFTGMMTAPIPIPVPRAEPTQAAAAPAPLPPEKPKRVTPPPQQASNLLDDNQIAALKTRLHLTSDQIEYWPAVEEALRDVVRTQLRTAGRHSHGVKPNIDVNSPEVQKLIWAAMPLLMRLRDDQKNEVRKLARVIGLDQVASQI